MRSEFAWSWGLVAVFLAGCSLNTDAQIVDVEEDTDASSGGLQFVVTGVSITPTPALNDATLACGASTNAADPAGVTFAYTWDRGPGTPSIGSTAELSLVGLGLAPQDPLRCSVVATLGGQSDTGETSITLANRDPLIASVSVSPESAIQGTALTCTAAASDPDGSPVSVSYSWSNGAVGSTYVVAESPGTSLSCLVTASDPHGGSAAASSAVGVAVTNALPAVSTPVVTPDVAYTGDTLTCAATATDPDGPTPSITYSWSNGEAGASMTLTAENSDVGDAITCTAMAIDAFSASAAATSAPVDVENSAPIAPGVEVSPAAPVEGSLLICEVVADAVDVDGDDVSYSFEWTVDGTPYTGATDADEASVVSGTEVFVGDTWECTVYASDGLDEDSSSAAVTVQEPLLLDDYPTAFGGYSLRRLDMNYAGPCLRVRRSSDDAEQDIGFSDGWLDEVALLEFVGTGATNQGYVVTWYDQSGVSGGSNYTQSTKSIQPLIVQNGVVTEYAGRPAIRFVGGGKGMGRLWGTLGTPASLSMQTVFVSTNTGGSYILYASGSNQYAGVAIDGANGTSNSDDYMVYRDFNGNGLNTPPSSGTFKNGAAVTVTTRDAFYDTFAPSSADFHLWSLYGASPGSYWTSIWLGSYNFYGIDFQGYLGESILWAEDNVEDNAAITADIRGAWGI